MKTIEKTLPTQVLIPCSHGLVNDSLLLAEQIRTIDRSRLLNYIGHISKEIKPAVDKALAVSLEIERPSKGEMIVMTLCPQCENDFRRSGYLLVKKGWQEVKKDCGYCKTAKGLTFGIFY